MAEHSFRKQSYLIHQLWLVSGWELLPRGDDFLALPACFIGGQKWLNYSEDTSEQEMQVLWPLCVGLMCAEVAKAQGCGWGTSSLWIPGYSHRPSDKRGPLPFLWIQRSVLLLSAKRSPSSWPTVSSVFQGKFLLSLRLKSAFSIHLIPWNFLAAEFLSWNI